MWGQALRFGFIGAVATAVHMLIGLILIRTGWSAVWANAIAFTVAFVVSFGGHLRYSFAGQKAKMSIAFWRFVIVGLTGFGCNQTTMIGLISFNLVSDAAALIIATSFAALVTFSLSRFWAFAADQTTTHMCIHQSKDRIISLTSLRRG